MNIRTRDKLLWVAACGVLVGGLGVASLKSCDIQKAPSSPLPMSSPAVVVGNAAGEATASGLMEITRTRRAPGLPATSTGMPGGSTVPPGESPGGAWGGWEEVETIRVHIGTSAIATSSAAASLPGPERLERELPRFGVIVGTFPGFLAADFRVMTSEIGPITLGLDIEGNHLQAGIGLSVSSAWTGPSFAAAGVSKGYTLAPDLAPWIGVGARFSF